MQSKGLGCSFGWIDGCSKSLCCCFGLSHGQDVDDVLDMSLEDLMLVEVFSAAKKEQDLFEVSAASANTQAVDQWDGGRGGFRPDWTPNERDDLFVSADFHRGEAEQTYDLVWSLEAPYRRVLIENSHYNGGLRACALAAELVG
ncbi:MAG: hypothetical protein ACI906_002406 [Candidatus Latescibacterota bacterium]|jgi:hypothetical protein